MTLAFRDIPLEVDDALRRRAAEQHMPVDQIALDAMKAGLGILERSAAVRKTTNLAESIRSRFGPLGGFELPEVVREVIREPLDFKE